MITPEFFAILMFLVTLSLLMSGYPVAFVLAGTSTAFAVVGTSLALFDARYLGGVPSRYFGIMTNEVLVAVPLFIFMGLVLERAKIAADLLKEMGRLFGSLPGGLGLSVIAVGALLAASTGVVGATVITMGLISLPVMLKAGYSPRLSSGVICASGTLGQIIPPSIVIIFLGDFIQTAHSQAQMMQGNFAPDPVSVGALFAGALVPGLLLVLLYALYQIGVAVVRPERCPPVERDRLSGVGRVRDFVISLLSPLFLIVAVLGSILTGIATTTESASVGAVGALLLTTLRGKMSWGMLRYVAENTARISAMVFIILMAASLFALVFRGFHGEDLVHHWLTNLPGDQYGALLIVMLAMFVLGFFLDTLEIIFIVVPITGPVLLQMGIDPIWLGVLICINLQTSFLTPPFGFALFYLRGAAPSELRTSDIYFGALPFVLLQVVGLLIVFSIPDLATWLPSLLFGPIGGIGY